MNLYDNSTRITIWNSCLHERILLVSDLTKAEKNEIAELAADKAYERFYLAVGKSVTKKIMWIASAVLFACWLYFKEGTF